MQRVRVWRVTRGHGDHVERRVEIIVLGVHCRKVVPEFFQSAKFFQTAQGGDDVLFVAVLEIHVTAVTRHRTENIRMAHREHQRAIAARAFANDRAMVAVCHRSIFFIGERDQFFHDVIFVLSDRRRVHILTAAEIRKAIGHDENHRTHRALRDQTIHALREGFAPGRVVQKHQTAPGESGENERDRITRVARVIVRRQIDRHAAYERIAEWVAAQNIAGDGFDDDDALGHGNSITHFALQTWVGAIPLESRVAMWIRIHVHEYAS